MVMVDDELVDRINMWEFYYFAAATIVPLLEDFLDVSEFKLKKGWSRFFHSLPEESVGAEDFRKYPTCSGSMTSRLLSP